MMLDSAEEEYHRLPAAINPEPLWQLEFGSCWQHMEDSPVTDNPRDVILDLDERNWIEDACGYQNEPIFDKVIILI